MTSCALIGYCSAMLRQFQNDECGVAMVLFALLALVLIPLSGGVVDYAGALTARARLVAAADAAALAIASRNITDQERANTMAEALALAHYPTAERGTVTVATPTVNLEGNRVTVRIDGGFQTSFLPLIGIRTLPVGVTAEAVKNRRLDIVMVVQNSNGMNVGIKRIKTELKKFRKLMLRGGAERSVQIGLVPYAASVNVGRNATYSWLDKDGASELNKAYVDLSPGRSLFDLYKDVERPNPASDHDALIVPNPHRGNAWGGCVRARPAPNDIEASVANGGNWVALFARDNHVEPRSIWIRAKNRTIRSEIANDLAWERLFGNKPSDGREIVETAADWVSLYEGRRVNKRFRELDETGRPVQGEGTHIPTPDQLRGEFDYLRSGSNDYVPGSGYHDRSETRYSARLKPNPANTTLFHLPKPNPARADWFRLPSPNRGCVAAPIQPLTTDPVLIDEAIDNMIIGGNPLTVVGLAWGWRVLSPGSPFDEAQSGDDVNRIIMLFSNGSNFPGNSYSAYGLTDRNHPQAKELDARLATLCTNIKQSELGVSIYILNFADPGSKEDDLLANCASKTCREGASSCNYGSGAGTMEARLRQIANEVTKVRLSK